MSESELKESLLLTPDDLARFPVWEYAFICDHADTRAFPVKRLPVRTLANRVIGSQVRLANGTTCWSLFSGASVMHSSINEHWMSPVFWRRDRWFSLPRYHDENQFERKGPAQLAEFLGLRIHEVFPIRYDLTEACVGDSSALIGTILERPQTELSSSERIQILVTCVDPHPSKVESE